MSRVDTERPCAVSVSIYLALDMPVKAFVSLMKEKQNCHASISDPRCERGHSIRSGSFNNPGHKL
jgi:hypothetical protein